MDARRPYPLYNTTFALHRLSPLYTSSENLSSTVSLQHYAKSFRDILVGEVLRGVRVGLGSDQDALARVGALQDVTWKLLPAEAIWDTEDDAGDELSVTIGASRGIIVNIVYEKASYTAILLRDRQTESAILDGATGFEHFPLLLTRMPGSLRESFTGYLASMFDTRASILHLEKDYMVSALEYYISDCSMGEDGEIMDAASSARLLRTTVKDVQVVLGFDLVGPSLKSIDVYFSKEDVPRLVQAGMKHIEAGNTPERPFMNTMSNYIRANMALDLSHEMIKITKIACDAFVLSGQGKIKLIEPTPGNESVQNRATWNLVGGLIDVAKGSALGTGKGNLG
ncbi:kinetochore complex Sim4 subunit Fta1-domain-containing protein [Calycina marina]|uniref:Kinetochore complex Sim4 subunit Fta1-domain-containing protein n=1 Tax=Calycina marina TaxID=1763456 RepID=A0A9P7Z9W7_9HELO|nr:kinetochore complex Sim4 subunit Fta1-domain-containing protein [Calycina marina]